MFNWIESQPDLGRVDVCIANAGISTPESLMKGKMIKVLLVNPFKKQCILAKASDWSRMLDVNVVALCLCTQIAAKSMMKVLHSVLQTLTSK